MSKDTPLVEAQAVAYTPGDVESGTQNIPIAIPVEAEGGINTFFTGSANPTSEQRSPASIFKLHWATLVMVTLVGLALPIACLIIGMRYEGDINVCNKWAHYLKVVGWTNIVAGGLSFMLFFQGYHLVTSEGKASAFTGLATCCQTCGLLGLACFIAGWFVYGCVLLGSTGGDASDECPSSITDCLKAYIWINVICSFINCCCQGFLRKKQES
mmetsp:Transcript_16758/g.21742  ORF Transcript_16758/g.21742 Transcript_16758/m.21742 type:complete len:213 (-) Transcript_16758:836-1474(-)